MKNICEFVVVYDISSDEERRNLDILLQGYGFRIQESVFELRLNRRMRDELIRKITALDIKSGFVRIYRTDYASKKINIGAKCPVDKDEGYAFIV
jgi:CRISPR-associated protein Cas2